MAAIVRGRGDRARQETTANLTRGTGSRVSQETTAAAAPAERVPYQPHYQQAPVLAQ